MVKTYVKLDIKHHTTVTKVHSVAEMQARESQAGVLSGR